MVRVAAETFSRKDSDKAERQLKTHPAVIPTKATEGKTYVEVLEETRKKAKPEDIATEIKTVRQTGSSDIPFELSANTKDKSGTLGPSSVKNNRSYPRTQSVNTVILESEIWAT